MTFTQITLFLNGLMAIVTAPYALASTPPAASTATCLQQYRGQSISKVNQQFINFFSIVGGDTTNCKPVIEAMEKVLKTNGDTIGAYVAAALSIQGRKIILSPSADVGLSGHPFNAQYTSALKTIVLAESIIHSPALLQTKLREVFFYAACHAFQLSYDEKSNKRHPFVNEQQKNELKAALKKGQEKLIFEIHQYKDQLRNGTVSEKNKALRNEVMAVQNSYTYLKDKKEVYEHVDPLLAAMAETYTMFDTAWIDSLKSTYPNDDDLLTMRVATLYAEAPSPLLNECFEDLNKYTQQMAARAPLVEVDLFATNWQQPPTGVDGFQDVLRDKWLTNRFLTIEDLPTLFEIVARELGPKGTTSDRAKAKARLVEVVHSGLLAGNEYKQHKATAYDYLSQLAGLEKNEHEQSLYRCMYDAVFDPDAAARLQKEQDCYAKRAYKFSK